ncbi:hypothetical protein AKJ09_04471 [Labilithrix luteola]|uniref:Uncharacterized protein n=1 Tax=Labilithrix luteola TaxID=1391654 RepID=A0A0K1PWB4_9BACT|nr:hypothetical protein [Labilithrix luteola]AKU97807.1 hypothetical protein AKJ09_04471 [Labilithrix luteola]
MRVLAAAVAVVALLIPTSARAEVEPIAFRYEASGACPSESEFLEAVRALTKRWSLVPAGTSEVRTIRVRMAAAPSKATGRLVIADTSGTSSERDIVLPTCTEVKQALAVMVAVAIDPRAGTADETEPTPREGTREAEPRVEPVVLPHPEQRAATAPISTTPAPSTRSPVTLDLRVELTSAVLRGGLVGLGASMTLELPTPVRTQGIYLLWPSIGLGFRQSLPKERSLRGGSAEFIWRAGQLRFCPLRVAIHALAEVSSCVETNLGALRGSAEGLPDARNLSSFWADIGGSVWAAVNLSERFFLSSTVLMTLPLVRQPFALASGASVASVPPLGVLGGIGIGAKL